MGAKSFQELHRERKKAAFVGRADEILSFRSNLNLSAGDAKKRFIFAVSGQAGMGKSTLLEQYRALAQTDGFITAWTDEDDADVVAVIEGLTNQLPSSEPRRDLEERLRAYRKTRHSLESHEEAPEDFARVAAASAARVGTKLARRIPVAGVVFDFVDEDLVGTQFGEMAAFAVRRTKSQADAQLVLNPVAVLSPLFATVLATASKSSPVALFFDTFEETQHVLEPWLLHLLEGNFGDLPLNFLIGIAGRIPPNPNHWSEFEDMLQRVELEPFTPDEAREFLTRKGVTSSQAIEQIVELSLGLPILLISMTIGDPNDPTISATAVERVLKMVPEPLREVAIDAAIPRVLNRDVAEVILRHADVDAAFEWLIGMPFVESTADGWKYHDVIRKEFIKFAKRHSPLRWIESHRGLREHYQKLQEEAIDARNRGAIERYTVEHIYHNICVGDQSGITSVNELCLKMWDLEPDAARQWASPMKDAEEDTGGDGFGWGRLWIEAIEEMRLGHDLPALELLTTLIETGQLETKNRLLAFILRSDLYYSQGQLEPALEDANAAVALDGNSDRALVERAAVYEKRGEIEKGLVDCEAATKLVDQGSYRFSTYSVLHVRLARSLFAPEETLELLEDVLAVREHPWGLYTRGQLRRELGMSEAAKQDFKRAIDLAPGRGHLGYEEIGATLVEEEQWAEAAKAFEKALEVDWECASCWSELARCIAKDNDEDQMVATLQALCPDVEAPGLRGFRAVGLINGGAAEVGVEELERGVKEEPTRPEFRLWLSRAHLTGGYPVAALSEVEEALRLRPEWPEALVHRGTCRAVLADHAGAVSDWEQAERISAVEVAPVELSDRGLSLSIIGRYEDALEFFDRAIAEKADHPAAVYNRAIAIAKLKGLEAAADAIEEAERVLRGTEEELNREYGLAGLCALRGEGERAREGLLAAANAGLSYVQRWAITDPAWVELRNERWFSAAVADPQGPPNPAKP